MIKKTYLVSKFPVFWDLTLRMEATFLYETFVIICESRQCNISEDLFRSITLRAKVSS